MILGLYVFDEGPVKFRAGSEADLALRQHFVVRSLRVKLTVGIVRRIGFFAACVALSVCTSRFAHAQSNWFPFTLPWEDASRTVIDASDLLIDFPGQDPATVIDSRGAVRVGSDGHFYFEKTGKRARFWGVNFVFNANFPPSPDQPLRAGEYPDQQVSEKVARRLAKLGVNVVRFHHMDFFASPNGIFDPRYFPNDTQHLDAGQLERLDYLIYQLRRNGIYVNLNLKVARHFGPGDGIEESAQFTGGLSFFQGVSHFNPRMIELQKEYARALLTHRNPYTGLTYAEDPAVLCVEIANEDSLFGNLLTDGGLNYLAGISGSLPQRYSQELDSMWNEWLRARYKTQANLAESWKYKEAQVDQSDQMRNGSFENGLTGWTVQQIAEARAISSVEPGAGPDQSACLRVEVVSDGVNWHVQAFQNGHAAVRSATYEMSFYAKAAVPGPITLDVMKGAPPWQNYGLSKTFQLTTGWQRYTAQFQANETDSSTVRPTFELGAVNNTVWIDQVEFRQTVPKDLEPGENLDAGNIARPIRSQLGGYTPQRILDLFRFYSELDEKYFREMSEYLKEEFGLKALVTGTAPWWAYLGDIANQSKLDFVDGHYYWDHPSWVGVPAWSPTGWRIRNDSLINQLQDLSTLASMAVAGKPFTVSEFNYVFPNRHALEGPLLISLIGNLQDWDAVYMFDYAGSTAHFDNDFTTSFFSMAGNPIKTAQLPIASRIFLGRQNKSAAEQILIELNRDELALGYARGLVNASRLLADKGLDRRAFLRSKLRISTFDRSESVSINGAIPGSTIASSNGELLWNNENSSASYLTVRGTGIQGAIGFLKNQSIDLGEWNVQARGDSPEHFAILLQARDASSLREARRIILSVWTEHQNSNMVWNAAQTTVENRWGTAPTVLRPVSLEILHCFLGATAVHLFALDEKGERKSEIAVTKAGDSWRFAVDTARDRTLWYEIALNEASAVTNYNLSSPGVFQLYTDSLSSLQVGWMEIQNKAVKPRVLSLLEYHSRGTLTSMVRLPVARPAVSFLVPVIRDSIAETGVALLNAQAAPLSVTMRLRDASGAYVSDTKTETLKAGESKAFFVQERFALAARFEGSLEIISVVPVIAFALRSAGNAGGDIFLTPYPVDPPTSSGPLYFAQLATDDSWSSEIILLNSHNSTITLSLEFFSAKGQLSSAGSLPASNAIRLLPGEIRRVSLPRGSPAFYGYARVSLASGPSLPAVTAVLTRWEKGAPASEAGISANTAALTSELVAADRPWQRTALALLNVEDKAVTVDLELTGAELPLPSNSRFQVKLEAGEKRAFFLDEVFLGLPSQFTALLSIQSNSPVAVLALLGISNARSEFLISAVEDSGDGGNLDPTWIIPRFVTGSGYRTILYLTLPSGDGAQGEVRFFDTSGRPLSLNYR